MPSENRAGRPRASSREMLAEAASELFLEKGYVATSVADITTRAGVSRSSFFNYFSGKADVLWGGLDERIGVLTARLRDEPIAELEVGVRAAVAALGADFAPDALALAVAHAEAMELADELEREAGVRRARIAAAVAERLRRSGIESLRAEVVGAAYGGAVLAAIVRWAALGPGRIALAEVLDQALDAVPPVAAPGRVRQLRVVARAEEFEEALHFYRDVVGMPERASFEGAGDARVAILDAGQATLELSNPAQIALIDAVETDGTTPSERIRIALEVPDAAGATRELVAGGATLEATARLTPWSSLNSRLRAPADLQLTLFEEGAAH
jgi:AcrR family transcriptional regulator